MDTSFSEKPASSAKRLRSSLKSRNVVVDRHRTSMRLEPEMWDGLAAIARSEQVSINQLCTAVAGRSREASLTSSIRVFVVRYFRDVAERPADPNHLKRALDD